MFKQQLDIKRTGKQEKNGKNALFPKSLWSRSLTRLKIDQGSGTRAKMDATTVKTEHATTAEPVFRVGSGSG